MEGRSKTDVATKEQTITAEEQRRQVEGTVLGTGKGTKTSLTDRVQRNGKGRKETQSERENQWIAYGSLEVVDLVGLSLGAVGRGEDHLQLARRLDH